MSSKSLLLLRQKLDAIKNIPLSLTLRHGHSRMIVRKGTIIKTYPGIFTVKICSPYGTCDRIMAFSYADLLTKTVEISHL